MSYWKLIMDGDNVMYVFCIVGNCWSEFWTWVVVVCEFVEKGKRQMFAQ